MRAISSSEVGTTQARLRCDWKRRAPSALKCAMPKIHDGTLDSPRYAAAPRQISKKTSETISSQSAGSCTRRRTNDATRAW